MLADLSARGHVAGFTVLHYEMFDIRTVYFAGNIFAVDYRNDFLTAVIPSQR